MKNLTHNSSTLIHKPKVLSKFLSAQNEIKREDVHARTGASKHFMSSNLSVESKDTIILIIYCISIYKVFRFPSSLPYRFRLSFSMNSPLIPRNEWSNDEIKSSITLLFSILLFCEGMTSPSLFFCLFQLLASTFGCWK